MVNDPAFEPDPQEVRDRAVAVWEAMRPSFQRAGTDEEGRPKRFETLDELRERYEREGPPVLRSLRMAQLMAAMGARVEIEPVPRVVNRSRKAGEER